MNFEDLGIVIAVKNGAATIDKTLESISEVMAAGGSLYVFDAESTDETRDKVCSRYHSVHYVCKNDGGLYYAWNNAIEVVQQPYLFFLNSDDTLCSAGHLYSLIQRVRQTPQLIAASGKTVMTRPDGAVRHAGGPLRRDWFFGDMPVVTVATVFSVSALRAISGFDTRYRISSDYDAVLRLTRKYSYRAFAFLDTPVIYFSLEGMSNKQRKIAFREIRVILRRNIGPLALIPHMGWYLWNETKRRLLTIYMLRHAR